MGAADLGLVVRIWRILPAGGGSYTGNSSVQTRKKKKDRERDTSHLLGTANADGLAQEVVPRARDGHRHLLSALVGAKGEHLHDVDGSPLPPLLQAPC